MGINKKYLAAAMNSVLFEGIEEKKVKKFIVKENLFKSRKNEKIVAKGENAERFFAVLLKGTVLVTTDEVGKGVILRGAEQSAVLGSSLISNQKEFSHVTITSLNNVVYLKITEEMMATMLQENPQYIKNVMKIMSSDMAYLVECINRFTADSAEQKLALYLKKHTIETTKDGKKEYKVNIKTSITKFATTLNLGRASLYRAIATLENNYVILRDKKEVKILDMNKLEKICGEE